jgi:hypothetical protein
VCENSACGCVCQDRFHPAFLERLSPKLRCITDWLPSYVQEYGDEVLGPETQFWAYGARTTGVSRGDTDNERNRRMLSPKMQEAQEAAKQSLVEQAARQRRQQHWRRVAAKQAKL